jgi:hypothetical protein
MYKMTQPWLELERSGAFFAEPSRKFVGFLAQVLFSTRFLFARWRCHYSFLHITPINCCPRLVSARLAKNNLPLKLELHRQGDKIGRIFSQWATTYIITRNFGLRFSE